MSDNSFPVSTLSEITIEPFSQIPYKVRIPSDLTNDTILFESSRKVRSIEGISKGNDETDLDTNLLTSEKPLILISSPNYKTVNDLNLTPLNNIKTKVGNCITERSENGQKT
ncbi:hypothetical protein BpHYR1_007672 [Brachionus plicatilis]|uniref:Uncharacterized protein n=1 Tax=Brachionus plicatilis TaxID=10195 RepID=A0A3M7T484_BRAPC|nr:hypothetical protein BpHYR1_007672 [Brachionus plicatilis]